jgi:hypothetical protein
MTCSAMAFVLRYRDSRTLKPHATHSGGAFPIKPHGVQQSHSILAAVLRKLPAEKSEVNLLAVASSVRCHT